MKKLTKKQKEALSKYEPRDYIRDSDFSTLLFFEEMGFGGFTVSELIDVFVDYLNSKRKRGG